MSSEVSPGITVDPDVAFGKPVIAGTRTPVAVVLGEIAGGATSESVQGEYDLTAKQVWDAVRYAARLVETASTRSGTRMNWLRKRAEDAAHDIAYDNPGAADIAKAIEAVAREFAQRALLGAGLSHEEASYAMDEADE